MVLILFSINVYAQQPNTKMAEIGYCLAYYSFWNNVSNILQIQPNVFDGKISELETIYLKNYTFDNTEFKNSFKEKAIILLLEVKSQDLAAHNRDYLFCQHILYSE